jgi:hypothetical protein
LVAQTAPFSRAFKGPAEMHSIHPNIQPNQRLSDDLEVSDIRPEELWIYYLGIGGLARESEVRAYLNGTLALPTLQRELLEHAHQEMISYA